MINMKLDVGNLKWYLDEAIMGREKTVVVGCEADIGKDKILNLLKEQAKEKGVLALTTTCTMQKDEKPIIDMLSRIAEKTLIPIKKDYITIEEVFIISKAGLMITHTSRKQINRDEQLTSGMLSALQDFVRYSFRGEDTGGGLARLDYADTTILIEQGMNIFAAVVTQAEHPQVREDLKKIVEIIEEIYRDVLAAWDGDSTRFTGAESIIKAVTNKKYPIETNLENEKKEIYRNVISTIQTSSEKKPLLLIMDNMQWADKDTVEMTQYIVENTKDTRTMVCLMYRPEENNPVLNQMLDIMRKQRQTIEVKVEMRKRLDRYYGIDSFGPVFGVRIPKKCVKDFDEEDANNIIGKMEKINMDELRKRMISIYMISDTDYKEMKTDEFFNMLAKMKGLETAIDIFSTSIKRGRIVPRY